MSYDQVQRISHSFNAVNFGSNSTRYLKGPAGRSGRMVDVLVAVTTAFVGTTTAGKVEMGPVGGSATEQVNMTLGSTSSEPAVGTVLRASDNPTVDLPGSPPQTLPATYCEPDTVQQVSFVAPTGGSPAGVADVTIVIDWCL